MVITANRKNVITMAEQFRKAQDYVWRNENTLRATYGNKFVAILENEILGSDLDFIALWQRTARHYWERGNVNQLPVISTVEGLSSGGVDSYLGDKLFRYLL